MAKLTGTVHEAYVTARELNRVCVRMRLKMIHECKRKQDSMLGTFDMIVMQLCTGVAGTSRMDPIRARQRLELIREMVLDVEDQLRVLRRSLKRVVAAHGTAASELAERLRELVELRISELDG